MDTKNGMFSLLFQMLLIMIWCFLASKTLEQAEQRKFRIMISSLIQGKIKFLFFRLIKLIFLYTYFGAGLFRFIKTIVILIINNLI